MLRRAFFTGAATLGFVTIATRLTEAAAPQATEREIMTDASFQSGYADIRGLRMYYAIQGTGAPLLLLHGGLGSSDMFGDVVHILAEDRQVITCDLQAHGRTADIDRPMRYETLADDVAALAGFLGLDHIDLMGYSVGGGVALRTAIQHPDLVRRAVIVSAPFRRDGWYSEMRDGMSAIGRHSVPFMKNTPIYADYIDVAPRPDDFPLLLERVGDMLRQPYDWSAEVSGLKQPVMVALGDADGMPASHAAQFYELLGGSKRDGGWDGSGMVPSRLAILPGLTHYTIFMAPELATTAIPFLDAV
ncbi:MAG TPA: alpha/beta hydrolase [Devosiaceae bacterium]|jgi:pimeloyl-ACP methyl ester carboxylesterase